MKVALPKFNFFPTKFVPWEREKMKINNRIGKIGENEIDLIIEENGVLYPVEIKIWNKSDIHYY